jgi:hypothetical protein
MDVRWWVTPRMSAISIRRTVGIGPLASAWFGPLV